MGMTAGNGVATAGDTDDAPVETVPTRGVKRSRNCETVPADVDAVRHCGYGHCYDMVSYRLFFFFFSGDVQTGNAEHPKSTPQQDGRRNENPVQGICHTHQDRGDRGLREQKDRAVVQQPFTQGMQGSTSAVGQVRGPAICARSSAQPLGGIKVIAIAGASGAKVLKQLQDPSEHLYLLDVQS